MKSDRGVSPIVVICVILLFTMFMLYGAYYVINVTPSTDEYFSKYNRKLDNQINRLLDEQLLIDEKLRDVIENGNYTFEEPYVALDPYGLNALSALIIFNTKNSTSIEVYLNGTLLTIVDSSRNHVIPIYTLVSNKNNIVGLKTENNDYKEIEIQGDQLDNYLGEFDMNSSLDGKTHKAILNQLLGEKNCIRLFNSDKELVTYITLGNIYGATFNDDKVTFSFNNADIKNTKMNNMSIEMDYLGKITRVSNEDKGIITAPNLEIEGIKYISSNINVYKNKIPNYSVKNLNKNIEATTPIIINTSTISDSLINSKTYSGDYKLAVNSNYITFDFKDTNEGTVLLLVAKNSKYSYTYEIDDKNSITLDKSGEYALYIIKDAFYYNLLTTIEI